MKPLLIKSIHRKRVVAGQVGKSGMRRNAPKGTADARLASPGSEARWREEVMPGRESGEVMLALTHQEAKTKQKEQAK